MNYKQEIINRLKDSDNWPSFKRPDFLEELDEIAAKAFRKKTIEGYLASLLIYHQLCEEMIKILIDCSTFFIQCAIFPNEIKPKNLKGKMFGQLIQELGTGVMDKEVKKFAEKCKGLNEIRIEMVHKLTLKSSLKEIQEQAKKIKKIFDGIFRLFDKIYDKYRVTFSHFERDIEEFEETSKEAD